MKRILRSSAQWTPEISLPHNPLQQQLELYEIELLTNHSLFAACNLWECNYFPPEDWLHSSELYERAEREYTLGYTEIERRILLNHVHNKADRLPQGDKPTTTYVNALISHQRSQVREYNNRLRELQSLEAPSTLTEDVTRSLKKSHYTLRALHQNKTWLINFLSR